MHMFRLEHGREIVKLASPTIVTMLAHTMMWTVDTALLGRVSSLALGAAGLGGVALWTMYSLFNNLSRVSSTFVSQAHGCGDDELAASYTWQVLWLATLSGVILSVLMLYSDRVLPLTGTDAKIQAAAYTYMWIRGLSAVATQLAFCLAGFFQGRKDVTTPMWAGIIGNLVNIVLDIVLIFGVAALGIEPMGIAGAAWATTIGAYVQTAVLLYAVLLPRQLRQRYALQRPRMPRLLPLWKVIRVGVPASVYGFLDMGFFLLFTSYVGRQGEAALAANQITVQLLSFSFMPVFGLSVAATVLVGNALGAKNPDLAVQYARECFLVSVFYCSAVAVIFVCGGQHIFALFSTDPEVLILAAGLAQAAAVFQFFDGAQLMGNGVLGGAGDTRVPMLYTLVSLWLLALPAVYWVLVVAEQSVLLGWFAAAAGYGVMATAIFVRVYRGRWRHLKLLQATDAAVLNGST